MIFTEMKEICTKMKENTKGDASYEKGSPGSDESIEK